MKKLTVLALLGFLVSCHTTESLSSNGGTGSQSSPSKDKTAESDVAPVKLSKKEQAAKATENAGDIQMKPASSTGDLSNPKASPKQKRN